MKDDPSTQDPDDAGQAMDSFEAQLRRLHPAGLTPEQQYRVYNRLRISAALRTDGARLNKHRCRYLRTGATFRERMLFENSEMCRRAQERFYSSAPDYAWARLVIEQRQPVRSFLQRTVLRWPWLTLLLAGWAAVYGACRLCGWMFH